MVTNRLPGGVLIAPAKVPPAIIGKLNQETLRAHLPDVKERPVLLGAEVVGNSPAEARKFLREEVAKWAKTVKAAGITTEQ